MQEITGKHVLYTFLAGFGIIISVNLCLAFNAIRTFPGLEVENSYVASQHFDAARTAQENLNWDVDAWIADERLYLSIRKDDLPVESIIEAALFGRPTSVAEDQALTLAFDGTLFWADINAGAGNWNLRLKARDADGTRFEQRIIVGHKS